MNSSMVPISLQLYTLRNEMQEDFIGTLKKVKEIGYSAVEFAGYANYEAKELNSILQEIGLKASSSHCRLPDLESKLDYLIEYNHSIGSQYIVCPWIPKEEYNTKESYLKLAEVLDKMGEKCNSNGILFCYHNHEFEFETFDGQSGLELLVDNTSPEHVNLEVDLYWAEYAGISGIEFLRKHAQRCKIVHLKDMANTPQREFTELGNGTLDLVQVLTVCQEIGINWGVVEQDICKRPPLESVKISYDYLKGKGYIK